MNIVHVHHHYYPVIGGLERVVERIAEQQARLGNNVYVITSRFGARNRPKEEIIKGVHVYRVKAYKIGSPDLMIPKNVPRDILSKADVVHIHSQNSLFNVILSDIAKKVGAKVVFYLMAVDAICNHPNIFFRSLGCTYQKLLTKKAIRNADLILVKSIRDNKILRSVYGVDHIRYVPDGIDAIYFSKNKIDYLFREKFNIGKNVRVFLYVGRLHHVKGPQVLIRSIPYLKKLINEPFVVAIVGPGPRDWLTRIAIESEADNYVLFTGAVSEELKIAAIDASTAVVVPSLYDYVEVFSLVASEAWARKKPVVASAVGELIYRVKPGINGLLVPPASPKSLAHALAKIVKMNHQLRISEKLYTWDQIAQNLLKIYIN